MSQPTLLDWRALNSQPMFLPELNPNNTLFLDFSAQNVSLQLVDLQSTEALSGFITDMMQQSGKCYGYGGYLEDRHIYRRGEVFKDGVGNVRNIHLGIDVWAAANTPVFAPLDATVHSFANNDALGDYGPTIILEHNVEGQKFYTLYGHLTLQSLHGLREGQKIDAGVEFCRIGNDRENGQWPTHLHFQIIMDLMGKSGDFPGVCMDADKPFYKHLCPDPIVFFNQLQAS